MKHLYFSRMHRNWKAFIVTVFLFNATAFSQNLVMNPSFENVNVGSLQCSWYTSVAQFNNAINNWTLPTGGSTDIFNTALATTCYSSPFSTHASNPGQQAPRTGNGYCNIVTYGNGGCDPWREYLQGQLTTPLVVGTTYEVEMWVTLADKMSVGTNNIGVKFSTNPYTQGGNCGYYTTPDLNYTGPIIIDKQNWVQIIFCYTPTTAGLDNFIIGNFYNDAATTTAPASGVTTGNTIRYYVEDVRIEAAAAGSGNAGTNGAITMCSTDPTVNLFNSLGGTPDMSGTWSGPSALGGGYLGTFNPSTNAPGTYTYSVAGGTGPCATGGGSSSANVVVTINNNLNATITPVGPFCASAPSVVLAAVDPGGTWSGTGITNATTGTFNPATAGAGTHTITYTIPGLCGDIQTTTITVNANSNATIAPVGPFCTSQPALNLSAVDPGGTWSGTGITNGVTGTFNPAIAGAGTFTITYTIPGICGDVQTTSITVNPTLNATITPVGPYCILEPSINLTAVDPGGTWSGTGITNGTNGTFDPATAGAGTHTITYTIPGTCGDVQTTTITIGAAFNATITPAGPFCTTDAALQLTAVDAGGTWSGTGITNASTGMFDPAIAGAGTFTITYTIPGICGDVQTTNIVVSTSLDATITPVGPFCGNDPSLQLTAVDAGGTWSGTGITNATNGTFDPATAGAGTHTITYTIPGTCGDVQTTNITINTVANASITPAGPYCATDPSAQLISVDLGGTWSGTGITNPATGTFDPVTAGIGTHTVTYTIGGACGDVQTTNITVNANLNAAITPVATLCVSDLAIQLTAVDPGGTWTGTGIIDAINGMFDPSTAGAGAHTITYTIPGNCGDVQTTSINVVPQENATITPVGPFCEQDPTVQLNAVDPGGIWSGTGITDPVTGTFNPSIAGTGSHIITYSITGLCGDVQTTNITVDANLSAAITPVATLCVSDLAIQLTAADPGGTWTGAGIIDAINGMFDPSTAGAGAHTITYTIPGNCGDVQTTSINVVPQENATITPVGPFCEQDPTVQLNAVDPGGIWSGTGITDPVTGTFDPSIAGTGSHIITYSITGLCGDVQTTNITVDANLSAAITPVATLCISDLAIQLTAADPGGTWTGTGIIDAINGMFDPSTAGAGAHTITYTIAGNCGDVQTTSINVVPQENATITPVGPFCEQDPTVQLNAVDPAGIWSGAGITDPVTGTFDPSIAGTGSHIITYSITGLCGDVQTTTIVVNALDDPGITAVGPFCLGSPAVNLVGATSTGTWSGTGITDPVNGTFDISTAGSGSHVITYTTNDVCPNIGTTTIDILDPLSVAALQDATICDGETSDLSAAANGGDGNYSYTWTDQNATVVGSGPNITVSPSVTTIYTVTATDGCTTPPATDVVTITVNPIPVIDFSVDNAAGCSPLDVTFTNNSVPQGTNCQWDFGDGTSSSSCGTTNHTYIDLGCYDVTLMVTENGCSNSMMQADMICVVDDPIADFTFTPESVDMLDPEFFFTNTSQNATSYSWDFGDGSGSSLEDPSHQYAYEAGGYTICLTAYNDYGCVSEICKPVVVNEGLIFYMPNTFTPDGDAYNQTFLPVFTSGFDAQDFNLLIFNRWGEVIWESNDASIGWDGTYNGRIVQNGTYVWKVEFKALNNDERMVRTGHVNVLR